MKGIRRDLCRFRLGRARRPSHPGSWVGSRSSSSWQERSRPKPTRQLHDDDEAQQPRRHRPPGPRSAQKKPLPRSHRWPTSIQSPEPSRSRYLHSLPCTPHRTLDHGSRVQQAFERHLHGWEAGSFSSVRRLGRYGRPSFFSKCFPSGNYKIKKSVKKDDQQRQRRERTT